MRSDRVPIPLDRVRHLVNTHGDRMAVADSSQSWSYRELLDRSHASAREVPPRLGPVAILMGNEPGFLAAMYGAWAAGRVALLIDPRSALTEIREVVETHAPAAIVVGRTTPQETAAAAEAWGPVLTVPGRGVSDAPIAVEIDPVSPALVLFTAGSTGPAKAVVHSHIRLSMAASTVARHRRHLVRSVTPRRAVTMLRRFPTLPWRLVRARTQVVWMTPMPLTSMAGITIANQALTSGGSLVTSWPFSPSSTWEAIRNQHVNILALAPAMLGALLDKRQPGDEASLVVVGVGAGPVPPRLCARAEAELGCPVIVGYGSTELGGGVLATTPWDRHEVTGDVGFALEGTEWKIVDRSGRIVPAGVIGELAHRNPGLMLGYTGSEHALPTDPDGWYLTGDLAVASPEGRVQVTGRGDERIQRRGNKVYPAQIERVLDRHPEVAECAVVGRGTHDGEMTIEAFVVPIHGSALASSSLDSWCAQHLSKTNLPDRYMIVSALPQTDAGEPRRADLVRANSSGWKGNLH
jgi:acyl-CoA synthetase (AMP-forming)/AMP-acid ligase II